MTRLNGLMAMHEVMAKKLIKKQHLLWQSVSQLQKACLVFCLVSTADTEVCCQTSWRWSMGKS